MSTQNVVSPPTTLPGGATPPANGTTVPVALAVQPVVQYAVPQPQAPAAAVVVPQHPVAQAVPVQVVPVAVPRAQPAMIPQAGAVPAVAAPVLQPVAYVPAQPVAAQPVASIPAPPVASVPAPMVPAAQMPVPVNAPVAPAPQIPAVVAQAPVAVAPAAPNPVQVPQSAPAPQPAAVAPKPAVPKTPKPSVVLAPRLGRQRMDWKKLGVTILVSAGFHALALLGCTFIVMSNPQLLEEIFTDVSESKEITDEPIVEQALDQPNEIKEASDDAVANTNASEMVFEKGPVDLNINDLAPSQLKTEGDVAGLADFKFSNEASGRTSAAAKAALVRTQGGNSASEAAVAHGMRWLSKHQFADGGWSFEHEDHPDCKGKCNQGGTLKGGCRTGATGMALLAFLGGGHTHQSGDYQKEVKNGVEFLLKNGKATSTGFDLCPNVVSNEKMYVQGLCTIALSELSALTKDQRVKAHAQQAVTFIVAAQNPKTGGWRYNPYPASTDPGDTSVVGWQVMALKSAKNAKLQIPGNVFKGAENYMNAAQVAGGSQYVYDLSSKAGTPTMTAAGLLCRMYLGWDRKNKGLQEGVKYLAATKPQPNNMYYNYYATQVMHHWGGDEWNTWNSVMRDQLIRTQKTGKDGHMQGSWDLSDPHGAVGGRLYMSCLCIMTLEVYYRHLPIYRREGLKVEF